MSDSEGRSYRIGCYLGVLFTSAEGCSVRSGGRDCQFTGDGIGAVGYTESDVPDLVPGTMKQQRLLATCPRPVDADDIAGILTRSIENW